MPTIQRVRCPNCGSFAERQRLNDHQGSKGEHVIQTACSVCDYLMVMSLPTGRVIEAYAPGQLSGHCLAERSKILPLAEHKIQISKSMV